MAIERAIALKQKDIEMQAAKAGSAFSVLIGEGKKDEAEAMLSEATELFNRTGEIERLQIEVQQRLAVLGGDLPIDRYNELLDISSEISPETAIVYTPATPDTQLETFQPMKVRRRYDVEEVPSPRNVEVILRPERRVGVSLAPGQAAIAYALFAINEDRTDFQHGTLMDVVRSVYEDRLQDASPENRKKHEHGLGAQATTVRHQIVNKLYEAQSTPEDMTAAMSQFTEWLKAQPEYASLSTTELESVARRNVSFEELVQQAVEEKPRPKARTIVVSNRESRIGERLPVEPEVETMQGTAISEEDVLRDQRIAHALEKKQLYVERRVRGDLGVREEKVAYALLAINEDHTDFAHTSPKDAMRAAFSDMLDNLTDEEMIVKKETVYQASFREARERVFERLLKVEASSEKALPHLQKFKTWIKSNPEYENLSVQDLYSVMRRTTTFAEMTQQATQVVTSVETPAVVLDTETIDSEPWDIVAEAQGIALANLWDLNNETRETSLSGVEASGQSDQTLVSQEESAEVEESGFQLSEKDVYHLAMLLTQDEGKSIEELGIKLHDEDKKEIQEIVDKYSEQRDEEKSQGQAENLRQKLEAFVNNKQDVFMANIVNEDAQYLLAFFASVDSEEKIVQLFSSSATDI